MALDSLFALFYVVMCSSAEARAYSDLSEIAAFYDIASSRHNKVPTFHKSIWFHS